MMSTPELHTLHLKQHTVYLITDLDGCPVRIFSNQEAAARWLEENVPNKRHRERHFDIEDWIVDDHS